MKRAFLSPPAGAPRGISNLHLGGIQAESGPKLTPVAKRSESCIGPQGCVRQLVWDPRSQRQSGADPSGFPSSSPLLTSSSKPSLGAFVGLGGSCAGPGKICRAARGATAPRSPCPCHGAAAPGRPFRWVLCIFLRAFPLRASPLKSAL